MVSKSLRSKPRGVFGSAEIRGARRGTSIAGIVILSVTALLTGAISLASVTNVPELVRAHGTLIPLGHFRQVQAPEQGIVTQVLVEEGHHVGKNQVLTILSSPELEQALNEVRREQRAMKVRLQNLHMILETGQNWSDITDVELTTSDSVDWSYAKSQLELFVAQQIVQLSLRQHLQATVETLKSARGLTKNRVATRVERVERAEKLFESNLTRRRDLELQRDGLDQLRADLIDIEIQLAQAKKELGGVSATLEQNLISLLEQTSKEKFDLEDRLEALAVQAQALEKRLQTLQIRAPEAGVIHAVGFPNAGEVIAAGTTLFEVMPSVNRLVAQLKIDPVDIGHIRLGDSVALKFDTFDARRFGQLDGNITAISPNSVIDEQTGLDHFRATVALEQMSIRAGIWERPLQVGMGASAEIVTDERTVLAYLIKPINRSLTNAFGER